MLSIIVASNRETLYQKAEKNIFETAGLAFEIIRINDVGGGLSKAYNSGARKAIYPLLCFVHDDVLFHTQNWCKYIGALLQNDTVGIVGVMGSRYKSFFGAGWRDGNTADFRMNVKDGVEGGRLLFQNAKDATTDKVVCLDGAFLCCTKAHWQVHPFDEKIFTGFHFYDLDFCMQMHTAGLKNLVTYEVLIEHFSQGTRDNLFLKDFLLFQKKWQAVLPQGIETLPPKTTENLEGYALAETLWLMKKVQFSAKERWRQLKKYRKRYKRFYHLFRSFYFGFLK